MSKEFINQHSLDLGNRILVFDGSSIVSPENIDKYLDIDKLFVTEMNNDISKYNSIVPPNKRILVKSSLDEIRSDLNFPPIDITEILLDRFIEETEHMSQDDVDLRRRRFIMELSTFKKRDLIWFLQILYHIVSNLETNNVVWGVGRGSSVSSYVLYLLRVHDIDSVLFELPFGDFMKII